jgi:hypothetical protein
VNIRGELRDGRVKPTLPERHPSIGDNGDAASDVEVACALACPPVFRQALEGIESDEPAGWMCVELRPLPDRVTSKDTKFEEIDRAIVNVRRMQVTVHLEAVSTFRSRIRMPEVLKVDFVEKAAHGFLQTCSVQAAHLTAQEQEVRDTTCGIHDREDAVMDPWY